MLEFSESSINTIEQNENLNSHDQMPFSLDHHCYSAVPGKIDRRIYQYLILQGMESRTPLVRADLRELGRFHKWKAKYTHECLRRLVRLGLIERVSGLNFHIPILETYLPARNKREARGAA